GHVDGEVVEPIAIGAPHDRPDDLEDRRDGDEHEDLHADVARLESERDREECPRGEPEQRLLEGVEVPVEGEHQRDERGERGEKRDRAARGQHYSTVIVLILSPIFTPFTTSMPEVTCPKFVYCLSRNDESFLQTKNWES